MICIAMCDYTVLLSFQIQSTQRHGVCCDIQPTIVPTHMTNPNNPDSSQQQDSTKSPFVIIAIPLSAVVPVEVLDGIEIFMTQGDGGDDGLGDKGVILSS